MNGLITTGAALTMSSREIAELTGKSHDNVRRDIKNMADALSARYAVSWDSVKRHWI